MTPSAKRAARIAACLALRLTACLAASVAATGTTSASGASDDRRSGFEFMTPALRAMQKDETANPGLLWAKDGEAAWSTRTGAADRSCASCHGDATTTMHGVAARYPAFDEAGGAPLTLSGRINACRVRHQQAPRLDREDTTLLALELHVARQSRGQPIAPPVDARLEPARARGEALWRQRMGQLDLSCAECHDRNAGRRLAGSVVPQAHPTGYPIYRLEWQGVGSLARRIRGCMTGVRAEPFDDDAPEAVELEVYLKRRAGGMPVETPAVRP